MCNRFNYFLWQWVRWRDFLMKHTVKLVKLSTAILLLTTATMFGLDEARIIDLPDFHKFSHFDAWFWAATMGVQAIFQFVMMYCKGSLKCQGGYFFHCIFVSLFHSGLQKNSSKPTKKFP